MMTQSCSHAVPTCSHQSSVMQYAMWQYAICNNAMSIVPSAQYSLSLTVLLLLRTLSGQEHISAQTKSLINSRYSDSSNFYCFFFLSAVHFHGGVT